MFVLFNLHIKYICEFISVIGPMVVAHIPDIHAATLCILYMCIIIMI